MGSPSFHAVSKTLSSSTILGRSFRRRFPLSSPAARWPLSSSSPSPSPSLSRKLVFRCLASLSLSPPLPPDGRDSGGGSGGGGGRGKEPRAIAAAEDEGRAAADDVIILDVRGMSCGGCVATVKRILESESQVLYAMVNLATETAVVRVVQEATKTPDWKEQLSERLTGQLNSCGYMANLRDLKNDDLFRVHKQKMDEKLQRLKESGRELAMSWALCAACLLGHAAHFFGVNAPFIHLLHSTGFHFSLSIFTFIGPGRKLILDGVKSLLKGSPNMNTLVGLGALSSFAVSAVASLFPKLGWKTFFEEPVMLIAFVLLGKNLEQRAKVKASSDMVGLLNILPTKARLVVDDDPEKSSFVDVPCRTLSVGDQIIVLPGDRLPVDGFVKSGQSTVDESSLTGEVMPVRKLPGAEVTAGSINLNGKLIIELRRPGGETVMGDIVRMVEEAQMKEAPVQRLADKVAGNFTYGVIALSVATLAFWSLLGPHLVPAAIQYGNSISLAMQLSCTVLVVACPCALGLATPTAVLVGTSLGAAKGLLIRGGNVLERFAEVDTVVFDKTGTLTVGKPAVTKVLAFNFTGSEQIENAGNRQRSENDVLCLAAGVESNTNHPLGKAILEAAQAAACQISKAEDGTFEEEPGSGAKAVVDNKKVTVGTLDWQKRHGIAHNPFPDTELNNQSLVYVGADGVLAGVIYFEDKLRQDVHQVIDTLSSRGISVYMLSGDRKSTAEHVASAIGIPGDKVIAGVKPYQKKKFITDLQKERKVVAMVGDGINDAAALASSDVGIAMGEGVGAASDVSSIVLMHNRLSQLLDALELSKETMRTVKQNLWWAFMYNIVGLPIAAGALLPVTGTMLTPSIAGALMGFSSVGVMANSLLLKFKLNSRLKGNTNSAMKAAGPHNAADVLLSIDDQEEEEKSHVTKWRNT